MMRQRKAWLVLELDRKVRDMVVVNAFRSQFSDCRELLFPRPFVRLGRLDHVPVWAWMKKIQDRIAPCLPWTVEPGTMREACGDGFWGFPLELPGSDISHIEESCRDLGILLPPAPETWPCLVVCIQDSSIPAFQDLQTVTLAEKIHIDAMNLACMVLTEEKSEAGNLLEIETLHAMRLHRPKVFP